MIEKQIYEQFSKQLGFKFNAGEIKVSASESIYVDYLWIATVFHSERDHIAVGVLHSKNRSYGVCCEYKVTPNFSYESDANGNSVLVFGKNSIWSFFNEATVSFPHTWEDPVYQALKSVDLVSNVFDGMMEPSSSIRLSFYTAFLKRHFSLAFRAFGEDNASLQNLAAKIYEFQKYQLLGE